MALFKFRKKNPLDKKGRRQYSYYYKTGEIIGTGAFSTVKRCTRKSDSKQFAVKIVMKRQLKDHEVKAMREEIRIMKSMDFEHVMSMIDVFDDGTKVRIILELCNGGDLYHQIKAAPNKHFTEKKSAQVTHILACTLRYLHNHYVVHRDLKPDNVLFTKNGVLKLADFGIADYQPVSAESHIMERCCGTPAYIAPEIISNDKYSHQVDLWALGCILYEMLSGKPPFNANSVISMNVLYGQIRRGEYKFTSPEWDNISNAAKDLVSNILCVDPKKRYTSDQVIAHPFITKYIRKMSDSSITETELTPEFKQNEI